MIMGIIPWEWSMDHWDQVGSPTPHLHIAPYSPLCLFQSLSGCRCRDYSVHGLGNQKGGWGATKGPLESLFYNFRAKGWHFKCSNWIYEFCLWTCKTAKEFQGGVNVNKTRKKIFLVFCAFLILIRPKTILGNIFEACQGMLSDVV